MAQNDVSTGKGNSIGRLEKQERTSGLGFAINPDEFHEGALNTLHSPKMGPGQYILQEAITLLQDTPRGSNTYYRIPAHLDVPGNELADEHVKRATSGPPEKQYVPPPQCFSAVTLRSARRGLD
ncbi:uncharacterized protein N7482_000649 [Penicillium canariense]|uniref:RNase H type-1 domain-containing protein n=1 Tax=Penicillium canariense TaxID=189055 RepID=A0A9W9IE63_9EURO|nr:uncharacterized protein N7482_000649 [Penicillium canariense]KAJ5174772.1 hypothetical protein N7482_000649 [Penicillium canariense]